MSRLGQLPPYIVALACGAWAALVVFLPRLIVAAAMLGVRLRAMLSTGNHGDAFGAEWSSRRAMVLAALVPPVAFLCAWATSRPRR